ncbi:hypothetical protein [Actinoplanes derwentensis]|uniref:Uncharacterized protein n=1 Tax=Actinoplanes derwentensis TaxID=113562 RepID=A0A1H2CVN5_9ACTN|nr:hypothetical protein [Actinoplanes derwentensis]GID82002.1 hypothetical protein Ade03nite_09260 [Actinoplanes derwentensis]SDT74327.1 hypothetical protein SAMN04489716_6948 [Actinoplanes derwentensis]
MNAPRVVDLVHYTSYGTPGGEYPSVCRAAVVTAAGQPGENARTPVALCVLNPAGAQFVQRVLQSGAADGGPHPGGTWHRPGPGCVGEDVD